MNVYSVTADETVGSLVRAASEQLNAERDDGGDYIRYTYCMCLCVGGCVWKRYAKGRALYVLYLIITVGKLGIQYTGKTTDCDSEYIQ